MQINTINKVKNLETHPLRNFQIVKNHKIDQSKLTKEISIVNCKQGNFISESRKAQLSKSLDLLQSQWNLYKIKKDHNNSKTIFYSIIKQHEKKNQKTEKKNLSIQKEYEISHKNFLSNIDKSKFQKVTELVNKKEKQKVQQICTRISNQNSAYSQQKIPTKWNKSKSIMSPSKHLNKFAHINLAQQDTKFQNQTQKIRLSLQNINKPSQTSTNLLIKQLQELKQIDNRYKQVKIFPQIDKKSSKQKPKLKITLNSKKSEIINNSNFQIMHDYQNLMLNKNQKQDQKCKIKLNKNHVEQKNKVKELKQQKPNQSVIKKCQIKAIVKPYHNFLKQQAQKTQKNCPLQQKKFGTIQRCNSKTLKITHITKTNQAQSQRKNSFTKQNAQKMNKRKRIFSKGQQQQKNTDNHINKKASSVPYMQIEDIIRMSYNQDKKINCFNENYFSLTTRS